MKTIKHLVLFLLVLSTTAYASVSASQVSTASSANTTSYVSGSFTPPLNAELFAFVGASGTIATGTMTDSQGLGFTKINSFIKNSSADTGYFFAANALAANTSMTVTFDCTGDAATGAIIQVFSVSSMTKTGATAILQSLITNNIGGGGTPSRNFGSNVQTGNVTVGYVYNGSNPAAIPTCPTGWTSLDTNSFTTPNQGAGYCTRDNGFTGTAMGWNSTSATGFGLMIVEIDTSGSVTPKLKFNSSVN